ncbi:MAG: hypothetical protein COC19_05055 [SAR86 cluster bacterium]|uniref:SPOR domain-containing protein n=1 Tax=SAR86 cluster bacterium TaxID=2030880 RepID=A0A2A4MMX2_9GAMM|nr:MAG: hypothetical protein COC19_05055 [SAR86 cluster bacterium]
MSNYVDKLGLSFDPFSGAAQSPPFFLGAGRQYLLDQLVQFASFSSNVVTVTAPLGSGKTSLAEQFSLLIEEESVSVRIKATLFMSRVQLLELICDLLEINRRELLSEDQLLSALVLFSDRLRDSSKTLQLIIDDAHELGVEVIDVIAAFVPWSEESNIHVLFLGESQLLQLLEVASQWKSQASTVAKFQLQGLESDEINAYINFQLQQAGCAEQLALDMALPRSVLDQLCMASKGGLGALGKLIPEQLDIALESQAKPEQSSALKYVAAAAVLGVVLLAVIFSTDDESSRPKQVDGLANRTTLAGPGDLDENIILGGVEPGNTRISVALSPPVNAIEQTETVLAVTPARVEQLASNPNNISLDEPDDAQVLAILNSLADELASQPNNTANDLIDLPEQLLVEAITDEPISSGNGNGSDEQTEPVQSIEPLTETETSEFVYKQRLLAFDATSYTLQLFGSYDQDQAAQFIAEHGDDGGEFYYFETRFQQRPWFVVLFGNFSDRAEATDAIASFSESLRSLQPWARNVGAIQADIRLYGQ